MINIQSDSRKIKPGDTFVAVKCEVNDGHKYIDAAIKNGASKIVVERVEKDYDVDTLLVKDTREYLNNYLEQNYNKYLNEMNIIAITGTNGKTTTAKLLHDFLNDIGSKTAYIGTIGFYINNKICDLPNTSVDICDNYDLIMKAYDAGCTNIVMEISSQAAASGRVKTLKFDYAIFTNLTQDHLDYHKTMGNYALAKQNVFKQLKENGTAIINSDDKYKEYFLLEGQKHVTYGFVEGDFCIEDYEITGDGNKFSYIYDEKLYKATTNLIGKYNIYNMLAVIATLTCMGLSQKKILENICNLNSPVGRMDVIKYKTNNIIIDYAHTPDAVEKVMSAARGIKKGKTYVVFGCTGDRDRLKRPIMTQYVAKNSDYFIITNDDLHNEEASQIVDDMIRDLEFDNYTICLDRGEAIYKGIKLLKEDDTLFILGKGHEEVMIIKDKKIPFNDKKTVLACLEKIGDD